MAQPSHSSAHIYPQFDADNASATSLNDSAAPNVIEADVSFDPVSYL